MSTIENLNFFEIKNKPYRQIYGKKIILNSFSSNFLLKKRPQWGRKMSRAGQPWSKIPLLSYYSVILWKNYFFFCDIWVIFTQSITIYSKTLSTVVYKEIARRSSQISRIWFKSEINSHTLSIQPSNCRWNQVKKVTAMRQRLFYYLYKILFQNQHNRCKV